MSNFYETDYGRIYRAKAAPFDIMVIDRKQIFTIYLEPMYDRATGNPLRPTIDISSGGHGFRKVYFDTFWERVDTSGVEVKGNEFPMVDEILWQAIDYALSELYRRNK